MHKRRVQVAEKSKVVSARMIQELVEVARVINRRKIVVKKVAVAISRGAVEFFFEQRTELVRFPSQLAQEGQQGSCLLDLGVRVGRVENMKQHHFAHHPLYVATWHRVVTDECHSVR